MTENLLAFAHSRGLTLHRWSDPLTGQAICFLAPGEFYPHTGIPTYWDEVQGKWAPAYSHATTFASAANELIERIAGKTLHFLRLNKRGRPVTSRRVRVPKGLYPGYVTGDLRIRRPRVPR